MHLPTEIIHIIVKLVSDNADTLRSCTLISRAWLAVARTFLLSELRIYASLYERRHEVFKKLIASPHMTIPLFRPKSLEVNGIFYKSDRGPDMNVHFLRWCASLLPRGDGNTTVAQTLFQSLEKLEVRHTHVLHSAAGNGNQTTRGTICQCDPVIPFPLLQQFTSVTVLRLVGVACDTFKDFWSFIREFAPRLKELRIRGLSIENIDTNEHGSSGERTSGTPEFPALVSLGIDLKSDCVAELVSNCIPAPNLQHLACSILQDRILQGLASKRAIQPMFDLLASSPKAVELSFLDGDRDGFYCTSEIVLLGLARQWDLYSSTRSKMLSLTHLTLELRFHALSSILSSPPPRLTHLNIPNLYRLEWKQDKGLVAFSRILQSTGLEYSLKSLWFDMDITIVRGFEKDAEHIKEIEQRDFRRFAERVRCERTRQLLRPLFKYHVKTQWEIEREIYGSDPEDY